MHILYTYCLKPLGKPQWHIPAFQQVEKQFLPIPSSTSAEDTQGSGDDLIAACSDKCALAV